MLTGQVAQDPGVSVTAESSLPLPPSLSLSLSLSPLPLPPFLSLSATYCPSSVGRSGCTGPRSKRHCRSPRPSLSLSLSALPLSLPLPLPPPPSLSSSKLLTVRAVLAGQVAQDPGVSVTAEAPPPTPSPPPPPPPTLYLPSISLPLPLTPPLSLFQLLTVRAVLVDQVAQDPGVSVTADPPPPPPVSLPSLLSLSLSLPPPPPPLSLSFSQLLTIRAVLTCQVAQDPGVSVTAESILLQRGAVVRSALHVVHAR